VVTLDVVIPAVVPFTYNFNSPDEGNVGEVPKVNVALYQLFTVTVDIPVLVREGLLELLTHIFADNSPVVLIEISHPKVLFLIRKGSIVDDICIGLNQTLTDIWDDDKSFPYPILTKSLDPSKTKDPPFAALYPTPPIRVPSFPLPLISYQVFTSTSVLLPAGAAAPDVVVPIPVFDGYEYLASKYKTNPSLTMFSPSSA